MLLQQLSTRASAKVTRLATRTTRSQQQQLKISFTARTPTRLPSQQLRSTFSRPHYEHSNSHPFRPRYALALVPFLIGSSTLLLDSSPHHHEHGLDKITRNVREPHDKDFLIADGQLAPEDEPPPTFIWRVLHLVHDWIIEPLSTTRRFIHLALLFLPVIFTAPILLLEAFDGSRDKRRGRARRDGERPTTRWWYSFLVAQMERAGPTFIKVCLVIR